MRFEAIRDRSSIERFLRADAGAHVYAIADLDDPLWADTRWFAAFDGSEPRALCLLLHGLAIPIVYAVCPANHEPTRALIDAIADELPDRFFYNLGPGLCSHLEPSFRIASEGTYWKMLLADRSLCEGVDGKGVVPLGPDDLPELRAFLDDDAYLGDEVGGLFFEPRMLDSGCYRGMRGDDGRLVAVGGVHVHSDRYGVAGVGNVVTRPDFRRRGLARRISAAVVRSLVDEIADIGLNVHEGNEPAKRCYQGLGFRPVCPYEEGIASRD
jgi:GNAT superfamily N-acetyltransferase